MILQPRSVRFSPTLGRLDVTIQKQEGVNSVDTLFTCHMDGNTCKVSRMFTSMLSTPDALFEIPNCIDASIAFDGYWVKYINNKVEFFTKGLPYIAYINTLKQLYVQQYNGAPTLVAENVTNVTIRRGWKALDNSVDQGLLIIYNKADGGVFYKSLQGDSILPEQQITELGNVTNQFITCNITTDYRTAIAITPGNKLVLTERCWAGVSSPQEVISLTSEFDALLKSNKMPTIKSVWNTDTYTIIIRTDVVLLSSDSPDRQFIITDSRGVRYSASAYQTHDTELILTCRNFKTAVGELTINYIGTSVTNEIGNSIPQFTAKLLPTGTVPNTEPIANLINIYNVKEV